MSIETKFESIGARVRIAPSRDRTERRWDDRRGKRTIRLRARPIVIDVGRDKRGEFFDLVVREDVELDVLQADPRDRHLLLLARFDGEKPRYLCGHDERHWFVAAVPESDPVSTIAAAKTALRPGGVRPASPRDIGRRRTKTYVRQGEWFFVPMPDFQPGPLEPIRRHEPIVRSGGGTPHIATEAIRVGGTVVYIPRAPWDPSRGPREARELDRQFGRGVTEDRMRVLRKQNPSWQWRSMLRDPDLYVRGAVRHPDHATVVLRGWHRVLLNRETEAKAMAHVVFLD